MVKKARTGDGLMPGDPTREELVSAMIRVDHAGEHGAVRIYEGQLAILSRSEAEAPIREMAEQERRHLDGFDALIADRHVRPTLLSPLWHVAGFALGAGTALLGPKAAMACTVAVEDVIDEHYQGQAKQLEGTEPELCATIEEFRVEEVEHKQMALNAGAEEAPGYLLMRLGIGAGSRMAIWLSERV